MGRDRWAVGRLVAGDLPAACVLDVAELIEADRRYAVDRDEAGLAGGRDDTREDRRILRGIALRRLIRKHPDEIHAELLDDRRVRLGGAAHLEIGRNRKGPVTGLGAGLLGECLEGLLVHGRAGRAAADALAVGERLQRRVERGGGQRFPAGRLASGKAAERRRQIVDGGLLLVELVAVRAFQEEALGDDELCERGAVLAGRDVAQLLAEGLEARIVHRARQRDGERLVRFDWRGCGRLRLSGRRAALRGGLRALRRGWRGGVGPGGGRRRRARARRLRRRGRRHEGRQRRRKDEQRPQGIKSAHGTVSRYEALKKGLAPHCVG